MITLKEIVIYPIKSIAGISVQKAYAGERGFENDRRWMLIDEHNKFITQRQHHTLSIVKLSVMDETIALNHPDSSWGSATVPLKIHGKSMIEVDIWDDQVKVLWPQLDADTWFSDYLKQPCRLVYMTDESIRRVDPDYVAENINTSLSDGYPYLLANTASLNDLIEKSGLDLAMKRFRPNLVVDSGKPYEEDMWKKIKGNEVVFQPVKPCGRCVITTIDPETGVAGKEPLQTLSTYRKSGNKILFGQNMIALAHGWVHVGETLEVYRNG
ncbi:MAG: MOSC domain-containing protein [Cyclobacteriaceae bacterium]|nr:MOSC domain-containing protein [Cyclobacteriaceae bacterium]